MNKSELKRAGAIASALETAGASLEELASELTTMHEAEQGRFDALGDKAKEGDRGQRLDAAATALQSAAERAQEAFDGLTEAAGALYDIEGVRE